MTPKQLEKFIQLGLSLEKNEEATKEYLILLIIAGYAALQETLATLKQDDIGDLIKRALRVLTKFGEAHDKLGV